MAIVGSEDILKKISSQIDSQFPGFIREEGPQFVAFMKAYFEYMEKDGNPINSIRSLKDNLDIDRTVESFVEYFRKEFMIDIPKDVMVDKRLLAKHIREFYRARGSAESYKFLFRALYGQEIELYYPGDDILRASDGRWKREIRLRVAAPFAKNPRNLEGKTIRGVTSGATAYIQDIIGTTAFGIEVYDMTAENIIGTFLDGERVYNVDDSTNYATINSQVGSIIDVNIQSGGAFHNLGDSVTISGAGSTEDATAMVTEVTNKGAVTVKLVKTGGGYTKENTKVIVTGGNGKEFEVGVASFKKQTIGGLSINTDLISSVKNVKLNEGPFFVRYGANSSTVSTKLTGIVTTSGASNTVTGSGTKFQTQLKVGDLVRVKGVANTMRVHSISTNTAFISAIRSIQTVSGANSYIGLAGANVYTILSSALSFSTNELYAINAIALINPGYGYTTLPTIRIVDTFISGLNLSDGYGNRYGNNAVVVANSAPGVIKKIRINSPGSNFGRYDEAAITNTTQSNGIIYTTETSANISGSSVTTYVKRQKTFGGHGYPIPSGIIQFPGRYIDTKGFLSWNNKLQDNEYYQEFSYVIRVAELMDKYKNVVKSLLHPAGTKMFGDYMINATVSAGAQIIDESPKVTRLTDIESITATDTVVGVGITTVTITESITSTDSVVGTTLKFDSVASTAITAADSVVGTTYATGDLSESITAVDSIVGITSAISAISEIVTSTDSVVGSSGRIAAVSESVSSTDSVVGVSTRLGDVSESITSTDSVVGGNITIAAPATESITSTDSVAPILLLGATVSESITSTDSVVGTANQVAIIAEQNGEITPYATTLVSIYQTSNISVLVTPFLNLDDTVNRA